MKKIVLLLGMLVFGALALANENKITMSINGGEEIYVINYGSDSSRAEESVSGNFYTTMSLTEGAMFLEEAMSENKIVSEITLKNYNFNKVRYEAKFKNVKITSYSENKSTYEIIPMVNIYGTFSKKEGTLFRDGKEVSKVVIKTVEKVEKKEIVEEKSGEKLEK